MMKLELKRKWETSESTIGELYIDGKFFCYTLEDVVRDPGIKVPGETAIPADTYEVIIDKSKRFGRLMPHILNVPMFDGIRIHSGNKAEDTEGCVLVGTQKSTDWISGSRDAFNMFFPQLQSALREGKVYITITNEFTRS